MRYLPNMITFLRLLLVPAFVAMFFSTLENHLIYAMIIFLFAGLTDMLDGYLARKYDVISVVGIVLDPLADKLMLLTALICLFVTSVFPLWILMVMVVSEGLLILAGIYLYFHKTKDVVPANIFGKLATVLFTLAVVLLILLPAYGISQWILLLAVAAKLISFTTYGLNFIRKEVKHVK